MSEDQVEQLLKDEPNITTTAIAKKLGLSRNTTIKLLEVMRVKGKIDFKKAGPAKIWFHKPSTEEEMRKAQDEIYKDVKGAREKARDMGAYPGPTINLLDEALREMEEQREKKK